jgi:hypothetical protein
VNEILDGAKFDTYAERVGRKYYAKTMGRPSIAPGVYFRCFLMGCFEGIDSERGIAYRVSDSLILREFLGLSLKEHKSRRIREVAARAFWGIACRSVPASPQISALLHTGLATTTASLGPCHQHKCND